MSCRHSSLKPVFFQNSFNYAFCYSGQSVQLTDRNAIFVRFDYIIFSNLRRKLLKFGYVFCMADFYKNFLCRFVIHAQRLFKFNKKVGIINRLIKIFQKLYFAARKQFGNRRVNKFIFIFISIFLEPSPRLIAACLLYNS